jgi:predicted AlkP superfamily pyrophosphatase or phosphodiesterase
MGIGLVVLHIDGLGADSLEEALQAGRMPFTKHLIEDEGSSERQMSFLSSPRHETAASCTSSLSG